MGALSADKAGIPNTRPLHRPDSLKGAPIETAPPGDKAVTTAPTYDESSVATRRSVQTATLGVLIALSASHMLNDVMQSLAPALYPVFHQRFALSFFQIGLITFVFQLTASFLQPLTGMSLDKRPLNWILPVGMGFTLIGLVLLAFANSYSLILLSVAVVGVGSAVFHPEASRIARAASGGRHGFAQSLFQVGGNFGQSLGPLLAAFIVVPFGQHSVLIFTLLALAAVVLLALVRRWSVAAGKNPHKAAVPAGPAHPRRVVVRTLFVLVVMLFSKVLYLSSLNSYYTFYLIQTFGVSIQSAQVLLFLFLAAVAAGTFLGGPLVDRFGAKFVIWGSILGVLPFTLLLPHLGLLGTVINSIAIGLIISSAFSAMVVYAQELTPGNVGAVAGLFFGLSFGLGGVGAALLGMLADKTSLTFVYQVCAFLPAVGLLGGLLPSAPGRAVVAKIAMS
jgi:MFS transporter, FSR family, fosmidomycin resistance protein